MAEYTDYHTIINTHSSIGQIYIQVLKYRAKLRNNGRLIDGRVCVEARLYYTRTFLVGENE